MKTFISAFILLISAYVSPGQSNGNLYGTVTQNGQPVAGARVSVSANVAGQNRSTTVTADQQGSYRIDDLIPGRYELTAEGEPGKGIAYVSRVVISAGESVALDLRLNMEDYRVFESSLRLSESVTIAAGAGQPIDEVSKTVDVISGQEMRDRADFALVDTLRTVPGFRVQQLGGFGRTSSVKTRGLRNQDTAILLDGIRFRDVSSIVGDASAFLSDITLTSVSKIEVLRGSGSSLYGTNAIGGTVNFITPSPEPGLHGQVSGAWGGLGLQRYRGNISDGRRDGKFGFNLGISRTVYTEGIDGEDDAHNTNAQARVIWQPTSKSQVSGRLFVSDAFVRLNVNPDTAGDLPASNAGIIRAVPGINFLTDINDPDSFQRSGFFNGQVVFTAPVTQDLMFEAYYSGTRMARKNEDGLLGPGFQSEYRSVFSGTVQTANANITWLPDRHTIRGGYEFERETFRNEGSTPDGSGDFDTTAGQASSTVFAQDVISLLDRNLQVAFGARAQWFSLEDPRFSESGPPYSGVRSVSPPAAYTFDGAVSYYFTRTSTKLRAHVGNGYRVPSLFERFGTFFSSFGSAQFIALGDPSLKPERSVAFDAGIDQELKKGKIKLTAVYFYTRLTDIVGFGNTVPDVGQTPRPFGGYINQNGGIARGTEFSGTFRPSGSTYIFTSYTYTNSDQAEATVAGSGIISTLGVPEHQFTLVATQRIRRFWVNFDFLGTSGYLAPVFSTRDFQTYVYRFNGNHRADVTAGYTIPTSRDSRNIRLFGTVENLFGYDYFENGFRTPGRNLRVGVSYSF